MTMNRAVVCREHDRDFLCQRFAHMRSAAERSNHWRVRARYAGTSRATSIRIAFAAPVCQQIHEVEHDGDYGVAFSAPDARQQVVAFSIRKIFLVCPGTFFR